MWSSSDKFYSTFLLQNAEHPRFNAQDRTKGGESIPVSVPLSYALLILRPSDVEKARRALEKL